MSNYSSGQKKRYNIDYYQSILSADNEIVIQYDDYFKVQCRFCKELFIPSSSQMSERIRAIKSKNKNIHNYFFCSELCKKQSKEFCIKSIEFRKKMSELVMGEKNGMWKKQFTPEHKLKLSDVSKSWKRTEEIKMKISKSNLGKKRSLDTCEKISISKRGIPVPQKTRQKIRESHILKLKNLNIKLPYIGIYEKQCLDELENYIDYEISRNNQMVGYFPDGYIFEKSILIEFDEPHHYKCGKLRDNDIIRENYLVEKTNCKMFRIDSREWFRNKELIISNFKEFINGTR